MQHDTPRRRSAVVPIFLTAALSTGGLTACSSGPQYQGVCRDDATGVRVDDDYCEQGSTAHGWYYYGRGKKVPAVGRSLSGGLSTPPSGADVQRGGFPMAGGVVERGGFGGGSGSVGG